MAAQAITGGARSGPPLGPFQAVLFHQLDNLGGNLLFQIANRGPFFVWPLAAPFQLCQGAEGFASHAISVSNQIDKDPRRFRERL